MCDAFIVDTQKLDIQLAMQLGRSGTAEEDNVAFAAGAELNTAIPHKTLLLLRSS